MWKRAAQFAPFAPLRGYEEAIKEAEKKNEESYEPKYDDSEIDIYLKGIEGLHEAYHCRL